MTSDVKPTCPRCSGSADHVMWCGIPAMYCDDDRCAVLFGAWSFLIFWITSFIDFDGMLVVYERGKYWSTLWAFVRGDLIE